MSSIKVASAPAPEKEPPLPSSGAMDVQVRRMIARELAAIATALETIGDELCSDPHIVKMHVTALQAIDELCQRQDNIGRVLSAENMVSAVDNITLESLRIRLAQALCEPA